MIGQAVYIPSLERRGIIVEEGIFLKIEMAQYLEGGVTGVLKGGETIEIQRSQVKNIFREEDEIEHDWDSQEDRCAGQDSNTDGDSKDQEIGDR